MKCWLSFCIFCLFYLSGTAQSVSINVDGTGPDSSAILDIKSVNKGLLIPRLTSSQMNAVQTPKEGLVIYNTTLKKPYYFDGAKWKNFDTSTSIYSSTSYGKIINSVGTDGTTYTVPSGKVWRLNFVSTNASNLQVNIKYPTDAVWYSFSTVPTNFLLSEGLLIQIVQPSTHLLGVSEWSIDNLKAKTYTFRLGPNESTSTYTVPPGKVWKIRGTSAGTGTIQFTTNGFVTVLPVVDNYFLSSTSSFVIKNTSNTTGLSSVIFSVEELDAMPE